jgi:excinuclease ABC subunit A
VATAWKEWITIIKAQEHNLKSVSVSIPKRALTVITGPSGSGKSSLALTVLYTEGKRRYMESLSSYARQFLGIVKKPKFERIDGLCPAIAIEQKTVSTNPRSTVGTITEIYDYLRVLYARIGVVHCPNCRLPIQAESSESVAQMIQRTQTGKPIRIAAPIAYEKKGEFVADLLHYFSLGYYRFTIDGKEYKFASPAEIENLKLQKTYKHTIDVLLDALDVTQTENSRLCAAIDVAFTYAKGICKIIVDDTSYLYSANYMCVHCALSISYIEPRLFSFNSPLGACPTCQGLGSLNSWSSPWERLQTESNTVHDRTVGTLRDIYDALYTCPSCHGKRLNRLALAIIVANKNIYDLCEYSIKQLHQLLSTLLLDEKQQEIAAELLHEIRNRLEFLINVGLGYLTLNRSARSLSGGEGQRIRLATQIGSALSGVLYILDEPSIGLHQRDNDRLIETLKALRDQDNTVVVVEHDMDTIRAADYVIDMGPAAGTLGGEITAYGTPQQVAENSASLTGSYLKGTASIKLPAQVRTPQAYLQLLGAKTHNLKDINVTIPLGVLVGVSGVSGSGKSSLILHELVPAIEHMLGRSKQPKKRGTATIQGGGAIESMVVIDQSPIGRTPRSNPATYLGIFDEIRRLYAGLPESNARGYAVGRFSFNVSAGRCAECSGEGTVTVEMHFLPEVVMVCRTCYGKRYNSETLQIRYKGKNIADLLEMTAMQALQFFEHHKRLAKILQLLCDVGLDYVQLGQASTTFSGGEAQRIKLVNELAKRGTNTLYVLDEPTTGLHSNDIAKLLAVLNRLVDKNNSMIIIEHNLDLLKTVDYIIDMGPEGGTEGGFIVAQGTPREVSRAHNSHTGKYLAPLLGD